MRKTLLAVGFAVIVSMVLAPHGDYEHGRHTQIKGFGPFFITQLPMLIAEYDHTKQTWRKPYIQEIIDSTLPPPCPETRDGDCYEDALDGKYLAGKVKHTETVHVPEHWEWRSIGSVMIDMLVLQAIFLAVVFAVLVNLRKPWRRKPKPPQKS
jgi:hypothetical protein